MLGCLGAFGHTHILPTGDILINSVLGVAGVTTSAPIGNITQLAGLVASMIGTTSTIVGSTSEFGPTEIAVIALGGISLCTEPSNVRNNVFEIIFKTYASKSEWANRATFTRICRSTYFYRIKESIFMS